MKGFRVGVELTRPLMPLLTRNEQFGLEFSLERHIKGNLFVIAEGGFLRVNLKRDSLAMYKANGGYGKIGVDYNMVKSRRPNSHDMVYLGARYAFSLYNQSAENVFIPGYYWPDMNNARIAKEKGYHHWFEVVGGIKTEVAKNLYLGIGFRLRFRFAYSKKNYSVPHYVPGFGKGSDAFTYGLSYHILYNFHL